MESHPLRMRGLKLLTDGSTLTTSGIVASFTDAWIETGYSHERERLRKVASFTDAWIETNGPSRHSDVEASRILYGCVDWNLNAQARTVAKVSRILYGCVDWNLLPVDLVLCRFVASFTDAWIETAARHGGRFAPWSHPLRMRGLKPSVTVHKTHHCHVASFTDAWIETRVTNWTSMYPIVASFTDAWIETRTTV